MKKYGWFIAFILALTAVSYYYGYHEIVFKRPQSVHKWRQSDCASIALNYYQDGMDFFRPETHNLTSDGGTSGKACPSELPLLYYTVAILYKVFGVHEWIFRALNTLLFFIGLFYLFKLFKYLLNDGFWAISLCILFFTSPVLVFYGNNFLSNSSSLAFSIVGWYYFMRFYFERNRKWFTVSLLFFLFAATFKVTALFSLVAIGGIYLTEVLGFSRFRKNEVLFDRPFRKFLLFAGILIVVSAWILYARNYNQKHECFYFSTTIFPIWELDKAKIMEVVNNIRKMWLIQYFHPSVLLFFLTALLFVFLDYRKNLKWLNFILMILGAEMIVYVLLQFMTFRDHDYYTIDMYIFPVLLLVAAFYILKTSYTKIFDSYITRSVFLVFVLFNICHAHKITNERYYGWMNNSGILNDTYTVTASLREMGVSAQDTVISIPDVSNVSLYLMNQKGWTEYTDMRFNRGEPMHYNRDSAGIQKSIDNGAKYMIIDGIDQLYEKPYLQRFATNLKGRYNDILVFDLRNDSVNFALNKKEVGQRYFCDAETLTEDRKAFRGADSVIFNNGETQTNDVSFSGDHSVKLNNENQYGLTNAIPDLQFGESFQISVWRKASKNGFIIASATNYYNNKFETGETKNGWEKLVMNIFVYRELENQELKIYLYNPEKEPVYFDDLEIIRFKSVIL